MGSDNETMSTFVSNLLNAIRTCSRDNIFEQIQQDLKDVQMVDDIFVQDLTSALFDCHTRHRDYLRRSSEELQDDDQEEEEEKEPLEDTILKEEEEEEQDSSNDDPNENGETCNENSHKFVTRFDVNHIDISSDCSSIDNYGSEEDSQNDMEEDLSNMHINEENMNSKNKRDGEQDTATINLAFEFNSTRLSPSKSEEEDYLSARATATSHPSNTEKDTEDPLDRSNHVRKDMDDTFVSCCNDTVGGDEFHDAMETQTHPTNSTTGAAEDTAHHHKSMNHANQVFPDISVEYPPDSSEDEVEEKTQDSQNKDNAHPNHENTFNTGDSIPKFSFGKTPRASSARNIFESTTRSPTFLEAKSIFEAKTASTPQQRNTFSAGASFQSKQNFNDGFTSNQNSKCNVCGASHSGLKNTCSECENVQKEESARSDFISTDVPTFHIGQSTKTEKKRGSPRRLKLKSKSINASFDSTVNESSTENVNTPVNKERSPFCSPTEYMELDTPAGNVDIGGISFNLGKANIAREKRIHSRKLNKSKSSNGAKKSQTESVPSKDQTSHDNSNLEQMIKLRDEGKDLYKAQQYRASIIKYTESVRIFTDNFKALPNRRKDPEKGDLLASLYGNRAAGWMMVGAYQTAYEDCQRALEYLDDFNPVGLNLNDATIISVAFKPDRGVTLMVKLLARMGRAKLKCGLLDDAEHSFNQTIRIAKSVLAFQEKARLHCAQNNLQFPTEQQQQCEKVLEQSINDASLNKYDITRVREHVLKIEAGQGLKRSVDLPSARRHNPKLLPAIDAILQICPADESKQEMKVLCLASSKKWTKIMSFCEVLGCQNVELDELYVGDLRSHFPFPGVPAAKYLKSSMKSEINLGTLKLDPNQVSEVALRLPSTIAPFYIRALRLEERYPEANHALLNIENFVKESSNSILSPSKLRSRNEKFSWISQEKEKVRKTMTEKENGDNCFRNGDYTAAASWYANAILIDSANTSTKIANVYDIETSGGRLHAVLHCNRAACLMALKEFEEAAKECTAALRIEKCYMKAIIRRARCYARMKRFEEAITEYDTWLKYMHEHRKNPTVPLRDECRFDRPSKISESDYKKAINERSQVQKDKLAEDDRMRKAAAEAQRRSANEYNRRQQWQHQYKSRSSWNFEGKSPNRNNFSSSNRYGFDQNGKSDQRNRFDNSSEYGRRRRNDGNSDTNPSPSSNNITCHYQVLQVPKTATDIEIKKAYRKLALKYHPDKNQSKEAVDTFRKVKTAYETLSDATLRRNYDFESVRFYY